jgi:phosphoserine phosphatase
MEGQQQDCNSSRVRCAIVYDFDGTLAEGDCAQHGLMPAIGITDRSAFWAEVKEPTKRDDGDEILSYLGLLALHARDAGKKAELSVQRLQAHGATIPLFPGVLDWFAAINQYGSELGVTISHYIVSSGLEAMIRGTAIAQHCEGIFACRYHYDERTGDVKWPCVAINYTTKTQYLFRINKGIGNSWDNEATNLYKERRLRPYPFERMVYIGDGDTDIPCMKMVKSQGGCSIAVFDLASWAGPKTRGKIEKLISEDRVSYVAPASYEVGSQLDVTVRGVLRLFKRRDGNS